MCVGASLWEPIQCIWTLHSVTSLGKLGISHGGNISMTENWQIGTCCCCCCCCFPYLGWSVSQHATIPTPLPFWTLYPSSSWAIRCTTNGLIMTKGISLLTMDRVIIQQNSYGLWFRLFGFKSWCHYLLLVCFKARYLMSLRKIHISNTAILCKLRFTFKGKTKLFKVQYC